MKVQMSLFEKLEVGTRSGTRGTELNAAGVKSNNFPSPSVCPPPQLSC